MAAATMTMKLSLTFVLLLLLLSGLVVLGDAEVTCANVRCIQGGYITCKNYRNHKKKLDGCACVCAPKNGRACVLHLHSGSTSNCTGTNY